MASTAGKKTSSSGKKTGSSTRKKTSSNTRSTGTKRTKQTKNAKQAAQDSALFHEIGLIVLFVAMVILFLCNFGIIGPVGDSISHVMFGLFGLTAYVAPIGLFVGVSFWFANEGNPTATRKLAAGAVLFLMAGILCDLIAKDASGLEQYKIAQIYENCRDSRSGGGVLAGSLTYVLHKYLETIGTILVVLLGSVISIILMTEKSLLDGMKAGGSHLMERTQAEAEYRRELAAKRREERDAKEGLAEEALPDENLRVVNEGDIPESDERAYDRRRQRQLAERERKARERIRREETRQQRQRDRQLKAEEKENEKILRMDRKVSGVMADTSLDRPHQTKHRDDIHEIILENGYGEGAKDASSETEDFSPAYDRIRIHTMPKAPTDQRSVHEITQQIPVAPPLFEEEADTYEEPSYVEENWQPMVQEAEQSETVQDQNFPENDNQENVRSISPYEQNNASWLSGQETVEQAASNSADSSEEKELRSCLEWSAENPVQEKKPGWSETEELQQGNGFIPSEGREQQQERENGWQENERQLEASCFDSLEIEARSHKSVLNSQGTNTHSERPSQEAILLTKEAEGIQVHSEATNAEEKQSAQETAGLVTQEEKKETPGPRPYVFPPLSCLKKGSGIPADMSRELKETAMRLQQTLSTFGVGVTITDISQGPTVTRYELQPEQGVKVSKIVNLADDIKLNLAATDIRIEAPIPGKAAIGIEVPNKETMPVALRDLLESREFREFPSNIAFAVGKDIAGKVVVSDIAKMPHMLIAGATGSGKSVCINTLIMSILYKAHPDDVKLIMVDPKVVELSVYNGIPHLLIPVVTDPKKASAALQWGVSEMTDRYQKFADFNVRDLKGYNKKAEEMRKAGKEDAPAKLPQIVIIVDELADLMMVSPGEVEASICRLAQLARAAGIHLIIATQRPSVDVITGLIKANMPSRVAFSVSSGTDSRTILDMNGAEKLLGKGDMLFYPQGYSKPARIQGAFVSDGEVADVVEFLKNQRLGNLYAEDVESQIKNLGGASLAGASSSGGDSKDEYFAEAGRFIIDKDKASIGMLQRVLKIGFNRAARIMDQLAEYGVVGEEEGTKPRKVLMSMEQFEQLLEEI